MEHELLERALYLLKLLDAIDAISDAKDAYFFDAHGDEVDVNAYVALMHTPELMVEIETYLEKTKEVKL